MARLGDSIINLGPVRENLRTRFEIEAEEEHGNGSYVGYLTQENGAMVTERRWALNPEPEQYMFAEDMLRLLNRELHHDGMWVIVFTHPGPFNPIVATTEYSRFGFIWLDSDGDPQFTMDWAKGECEELDFTDVLMSGIESWADRCEAAWEQWNLYMRKVLQPKQDQLVKKAQGQKLSTAH